MNTPLLRETDAASAKALTAAASRSATDIDGHATTLNSLMQSLCFAQRCIRG